MISFLASKTKRSGLKDGKTNGAIKNVDMSFRVAVQGRVWNLGKKNKTRWSRCFLITDYLQSKCWFGLEAF